MKQELSSIVGRITSSLTLKIIFIGILILVLQIPTLMIRALIKEREGRKQEAIAGIASRWGDRQTVTGPFLVIPVLEKRLESDGKKELERIHHHDITILPDKLLINGNMNSEIRSRGIYQAVLYRGEFTVNGSFSFTADTWTQFAQPNYEIRFQDAMLFLGVSDIKGLVKTDIRINGEAITPAPGAAGNRLIRSGFRIPLKKSAAPLSGELTFDLKLGLNGSSGLAFYPLGLQTQVNIGSPWDSPSFQGAFLPHLYKIDNNGFTAEWQITDMNRNYPQTWMNDQFTLGDSSFGVDFYVPANVYQQTERAVRYSVLFIIFIMMVFLFAERIAGIWMHPVQYFLVGLAIVIFYALLLSLGEHVSFCTSYVIAAGAVSLLVAGYCAVIFRKGAVALTEGAAMVIAYILIYLLLQMTDYALIAGCTILFILLALLMAFTGNLNKSKVIIDTGSGARTE